MKEKTLEWRCAHCEAENYLKVTESTLIHLHAHDSTLCMFCAAPNPLTTILFAALKQAPPWWDQKGPDWDE